MPFKVRPSPRHWHAAMPTRLAQQSRIRSISYRVTNLLGAVSFLAHLTNPVLPPSPPTIRTTGIRTNHRINQLKP